MVQPGRRNVNALTEVWIRERHLVLCWSAGRHMIILSLQHRTSTALRQAILAAPEQAGLVEVRLDGLPSTTYSRLKALFLGAPRPIVASCRRRSDGGLYAGSEVKREQILSDAIRAGARYIDVEFGSRLIGLADQLGEESEGGIIVSHHDTKGMPRDPTGLYRRMARVRRARAVKIVGTARRPSDLIRVRDLLARLRDADPPLVGFCMGREGKASRIMAGAWGSWATYVSSRAGAETAPGQLSLSEAVELYRIEGIDRATCLTGIIGRPLGHSLSPVIHNAAYAAVDLPFRFLPFEVPSPAALGDLRSMVGKLRIRGLAVTSPYKTMVMKHLDLVEPLARKVGAVNTVLYDGRRLIGLNTDATAGFSALDEALSTQKLRVKDLTVAIAGSGGAARALAHAVTWAGSRVIIASRSTRGERLARSIGALHVKLRHLSSRRYDVLINCTPLGMMGTGYESASLPEAAIKGSLVYDLVYRPETTALLRKARKKGIATLGGLEMLVRQAAEQFSLFTGRDAPLDAMRAAARGYLSNIPASRP